MANTTIDIYDYNILVQIKKSGIELDLLTYSGEYSIYFDNEVQFYHHFKISFSDDIINTFDINQFTENSLIYIDILNRNLHFINETNGKEYNLHFDFLDEDKQGIELILVEKIKYISDLYRNESRNSGKLYNEVV